MKSLHNIKLVTFDLDDTLWPCAPTILQAEQQLYDWLTQHQPRITQRYSMEDLRSKRKQLLQQQPALCNDLSEARRAHFRQLADECGYDHGWIAAGFDVFYRARQQVTFFDDVLPVLSALSTQFKLIALTNGNAHVQHTGLGELFFAQVSAADVQAAKPDPAMFVRAMQMASVTPEQTLHVGDHAIHDIAGARTAGVYSVWLNRLQANWAEVSYRADAEIKDLYALLDLLGIANRKT